MNSIRYVIKKINAKDIADEEDYQRIFFFARLFIEDENKKLLDNMEPLWVKNIFSIENCISNRGVVI